MRVSGKTRDNFTLYVECHERWWLKTLCPRPVSALEAFAALDSCGKRVPCFEPDVLRNVLAGKARLNMQIKIWAESVADGLATVAEFKNAVDWLPDWVWDAVRNQAVRREGRDGFPILDPEVRAMKRRAAKIKQREQGE